MERRIVQIEKEVIMPLVRLVNQFPVPTLKEFCEDSNNTFQDNSRMVFAIKLRHDIDVFDQNQRIIDAVVKKRNSFFSIESINMEEYEGMKMPVNILEVETDARVEYIVDRALMLQKDYSEEMINAVKKYFQHLDSNKLV